MDQRVAKRYARALFNMARRLEMIESVEDDLQAIARLVSADPKFRGFLYTPLLGRNDKIRISEKLFSDCITSLSMQALRLLIEKGRETEIEGIRDSFAALRREHGQVLYVKVLTSEPLDPAQSKALIEKLGKESGKGVEAEFAIDKSLIGGIKVVYGNYVLDGSLRGGLSRLRDKLRYDVMKQS